MSDWLAGLNTAHRSILVKLIETLSKGRSLYIQMKQTYKPYTLVGPTVTRLVQDPLAVKLLNKRL